MSVRESSAARAWGPLDQISGRLLSSLSYCSSPAATASASQRNDSRLFLHWDETPGQEERGCAGDTGERQLCSKASGRLLSRQRRVWRVLPSTPGSPRKLPAPRRAGACCAARLALAPTEVLALLCWWPARHRDVLAGLLAWCDLFIANSFGQSCRDNGKNKAPKPLPAPSFSWICCWQRLCQHQVQGAAQGVQRKPALICVSV